MPKRYIPTDEELQHYLTYITGKGGETNFSEEILKAKQKILKYLYIDATDAQKENLKHRLKALIEKRKR